MYKTKYHFAKSNSPSTTLTMDITAASLELFHCQLQYLTTPNNKPNYYLLVNPNKEKPLKLFKSDMKELVENLPAAFTRAKEMNRFSTPNGFCETIATINKRDEFETNLYVSMFNKKPYIFARLYAKKEGEMRPTTLGVRFSRMDNMGKIVDFITQNNKDN